ncbi:hypothetical protein N182_34860 [Sinorhizobium sp. GL2]|nr:hypothetical protein N182_34860 [Sinorhizobium sp. GL2]
MLIRRLELFIALARERHFGRAAEQCGVTQPTLSSAIKDLECWLGVMLVQRGSRFRALTPEGDQALVWAQRIVNDARHMQVELKTGRHGLSGKIRIAAIPTALAMVSQWTIPFCKKHPDVVFSVLSRTSTEILSLVGSFDVDVGITYLDNDAVGRVTTVPLYRETYHLVTAADQMSVDRQDVTWSEVAKLPLCLLTPDMQNRRIIDRRLADEGGSGRTVLESDSMTLLLSHVGSGGWSSIIPGVLTNIFDGRDTLRAIPIVAPEESHVVGMVSARRDPHTPLVEAFLKQVRRMTGGSHFPADIGKERSTTIN